MLFVATTAIKSCATFCPLFLLNPESIGNFGIGDVIFLKGPFTFDSKIVLKPTKISYVEVRPLQTSAESLTLIITNFC